MNASQALQISQQNSPVKALLKQAYEAIERAALQGLRQVTHNITNPEVFQELQAQGYTLTSLQGRNDTGTIIKW